MKFKLGCQLNYQVSNTSTFIFNICALQNDEQRILDSSLQIKPHFDYEVYTLQEQENNYFRVVAPPGELNVSYQATVEIKNRNIEICKELPETPPAELPLDVIQYLYPSRYCQSDRFGKLAYDEFGNCPPGYQRVEAICDWIYEKVAYTSGSTNSQTSAYDTVAERVGVCRDFAHLGIAFCRALNIPARFVSAYAWKLQPPDFHACFEAYLGNKWYTFDATRLAPIESFVRIGTGRDAADVSFSTVFGAVQFKNMKVYIDKLTQTD
ncbi:transglutaminase-like domain protein [Chondrocystis sp. NIES-4102]|nr:transglutaminase-like domain protein [Chondrocystis sp. NIES-4102]